MLLWTMACQQVSARFQVVHVYVCSGEGKEIKTWPALENPSILGQGKRILKNEQIYKIAYNQILTVW